MEERLDAPLTHDLDPTKNGGSYLCLHSRCVQQRLAAIGNIGRHISPPKTAATSPDPQAKPSPKCCRRTMQSRVHNLRLQSLLDASAPERRSSAKYPRKIRTNPVFWNGDRKSVV